MVSVEVRNSTNNESAAYETTTSARTPDETTPREESSAGFLNPKGRGGKMKKAYGVIRNRIAMSEYDRNYFADHKDQDGSWSSIIKPEEAYEEVSPENIDTEPMPHLPNDLEIVEEADSLEDALRAYDSRYSLEEIDAGKQSPQLCADMLLHIKDKYDADMSNQERRAVCLELIEVGHAIGRLAEKPAPTKEELENQTALVDRTTVKGLADMAKIITIAQEYAPQEVPILKKEIKVVADKIDSRVSEPISGPITVALEKLQTSPETPFVRLVDEIDHELLNISEARVSIKFDQLKRDQEEKERREAKAKQEALAAAEQEAKREVERQKLANLGVEDSVDYDDAVAYDPFADDEEDDQAA